MPDRQANLSAELRGPLLVLLIVIPILAVTGLRVHDAVARTGRYQHDIRVAQTVRAHVLRNQLDEETGIRGFQATGDRLFLEPYTKARASMPRIFAELRAGLAPFQLGGLDRIVADQERLNARWISTISEPLLSHRFHAADTIRIFRHGKQLVDDFRNDDLALQDRLVAAASAADASAEHAVASLLSFVVAALVALTAGAGLFGFLQARSARRAFEQRTLYENQKRIADALQMAFLNKNLPDSPSIGLHATYIPATQEALVGGDWYDAFELPDRRILFSIGDVAGHGIEAAIVMSRARQAIIAAALHENDPAKVLERANDAILLQEARMVTAICGYIDPQTLEITYATAGHPPPILARPGFPSMLLPYEGMPLGIVANATYKTFIATASDGAVMVLYTDGVTEHKRDMIAGEARLLEAARLAVLEADPALAIERYIFAASPPTDDVAILTVTFRTNPGNLPNIAAIGAMHFNRHGPAAFGSAIEAPSSAPLETDRPRDPIDATRGRR